MQGHPYVADTNIILKYTAAEQESSRLLPAPARPDSRATVARRRARLLNTPSDIKVDAAGNLYIADSTINFKIRVVNTQTTAITVYGKTIQPGNIDTVQQLPNANFGLALDGAGNLYSTTDNRVTRMMPNGTITVVAGQVSGGAQPVTESRRQPLS